ncbi:hypothetical protein GW17_00060659 [Ensete ventricosum]|nr:hypothetical protein GW17_00060659 [Ensete ventricosum]
MRLRPVRPARSTTHGYGLRDVLRAVDRGNAVTGMWGCRLRGLYCMRWSLARAVVATAAAVSRWWQTHMRSLLHAATSVCGHRLMRLSPTRDRLSRRQHDRRRLCPVRTHC